MLRESFTCYRSCIHNYLHSNLPTVSNPDEVAIFRQAQA